MRNKQKNWKNIFEDFFIGRIRSVFRIRIRIQQVKWKRIRPDPDPQPRA